MLVVLVLVLVLVPLQWLINTMALPAFFGVTPLEAWCASSATVLKLQDSHCFWLRGSCYLVISMAPIAFFGVTLAFRGFAREPKFSRSHFHIVVGCAFAATWLFICQCFALRCVLSCWLVLVCEHVVKWPFGEFTSTRAPLPAQPWPTLSAHAFNTRVCCNLPCHVGNEITVRGPASLFIRCLGS